MALPSGTRLGPYEILALLGAGGMGEVYRARDTRLDRIVAIKVLPSHVAESSERRQRFEREARAVSGLSHPHICALYDVGRQNGVDFLVMEYLEGESLATRLEKGPLSLEQVVRYGIETADALSKAHRQGLVHRDLKPANIMLTHSGAKLLDFGLAKAMPQQAPSQELTSLPTEGSPLTAEGTLVGTLHYMAPEQFEGKESDARTDIFALGAVLYEMATGKKAFEGKSQASVIAAILEKDPPPITSLKPMVPGALDRLVKKCLAKDPEERWQSAQDLRDELRWIAEADVAPIGTRPGIAGRAAVERGGIKPLQLVAWAIAAVFAILALALSSALVYIRRTAPEARPLRASILPPEKAVFHFTGIGAGPAAISPDGRRLAFVATTAEGKDLLWIRPLDSLSPQALSGTDGASYPFWSPDSRLIGFFADGKLKKIEATGGPALTLCDADFGRGGTWSKDGVILFAPTRFGPLQRVSAAGGVPTTITTVERKLENQSHRWPYFLPDDRHFLYLSLTFPPHPGSANEGVFLGSLDSNETRLLSRASSNVAYASGLLLFLRESTLMAQPFDLKLLQFTGDAFPVAEQVQYDPVFLYGVFTISANGVLAYEAGAAATGPSQLAWFNREGKQLSILSEPAAILAFRLSPDASKVAATVYEPRERNWDVWIYDVARGARTRFTFDPSTDSYPVWSPDGLRIVFASNRKGNFDLFIKAASGATAEEPLFQSSSYKYPTDWSRDGRLIAFQNLESKTGKWGVWMLPVFGDRKPIPYLVGDYDQLNARFSPDGRWVVYSSNETGRTEVYVRPFPGPGGKWQISTAGGAWPKWRRDGRELFYVSPDNKLIVAEVREKGTTLEVGAARSLFETRPYLVGDVFDVSVDTGRFLVNTLAGERSSAPLTLVTNWTADLKH